MAATSSLFGATAFAPQSAIEILRTSKQLPVVPPTRGASLDALAWGVGSANWQQRPSSDQPAHSHLALKKELRTLVAASFDAFMRLQRAHEEKTRAGLELAPEEIVRASREYREAVKTCIFAIEDRNSDADDELLDLLKVSLAMWHLCELLFLQRRPRDDKMLAYDLAAWLQEHYAGGNMEELDAETQRIRSLGSQHSAEQDKAYWPTVYALVATGSGAQAWSILSMHSSFRSVFAGDGSASAASIRESFHTLQRLLLCMPGRQSRQQIEWQNWRDACQYFLTSDPFVRDRPEFRKLMAILTAGSDALRDATGTWYDLMMARLVLEEPKAIAHRFEFLMANCFQTFHGNNTKDTMNNFDCIVLAILQHDVQSAVHDIYAMGFHWMSAHLTDLLSKANVIAGDEVVQQYGCSLKEYFLLQYVIDLTAYESTWQFTTTYFEYCPVYGLTARRSAIAVEPVTTNTMADRLLNYCHGKKGLQQTERQVSYRRAVECKNERAFASAFQWALRGGHLDETDVIGELVLDECESSGSLSPLFEAVEFLDAHPELARTKKLKWLVTYRELNLVLEDRVALKMQLKEAFASGTEEHEQVKAQAQFVATQAAKRLQDLLSSSLAPRRLRATLLTHVESLLEETPAPFTSEQLFTVMEFLESIERAFDRHEFEKNPQNVKLRNRLRQQLSQHLSTAILSEGGLGSFRKSAYTSQAPHVDSSRSFAALTAGLQLLPETSSHALVDFQADESME